MLKNLIKQCQISNLNISDRMKTYKAIYEFNAENAPNTDYFCDIINKIVNRDKIKITLTADDETPCIFKTKTDVIERYEDFISEYTDDDVISVKIEIDKSVENNHFSIYEFDKFVDDILSLSINGIMHSFSELFKDVENRIIFDVFNNINMFATKTMSFIPYNQTNTIEDYINRKQRIKDCKETSSFYNFNYYEVIPDDFKIIANYENNKLSEIFNKIMNILSIVFISSSSNIDENGVHCVISSQRLIERDFDFNSIQNNEELYKIYDWIYNEGNHTDKALLARNIIGLNCKYVSLTEIDDKVMASIKSNYELYLKENLKEYLELKNKIAEFISNTISRTGEYANSLFDKFKGNIMAIFVFIFSTIVANIVSSQPLDNIFNKEITLLLEFVLFISIVYSIICYIQFENEIKEVYDSYEQLKENYKDILIGNDLQEAFQNDSMIKNKKKDINKKTKVYLVIWICFIVVSFFLLEFFLSSQPSYKYILNFIKSII